MAVEPLWPSDQFSYQGSHDAYFGLTSDRLSYLASSELLEANPDFLDRYRVNITEYLKSKRGDRNVVISTENMDEIISFPVPSMSERIIRLLNRLNDLSNGTISDVSISSEGEGGVDTWQLMRDIGIGRFEDLQALFEHLKTRGFLEVENGFGWILASLTVDGLLFVDEVRQTRSASKIAFVAMWFSTEMNDAYADGIAPAVADCGYDPIRIDAKEHNNKIDDEIIAEIRRSRFVIADFSCGVDGVRGGVYFEAGFAAGLNIPVIFCVRERDLDKLHFDTRQFSHIVWSDPGDLRTKLTNRIMATIV